MTSHSQDYNGIMVDPAHLLCFILCCSTAF